MVRQFLTSALIVAVCLTTSLSFESFAAEDVKVGKKVKQEHRKNMIKKLAKMARFLELNQDQKEQIKAIFKDAKQERMTMKSSNLTYREQTKNLMENATFDEEAFTSMFKENQEKIMAKALMKAKFKHAIYQVLTDEQREKMAKLRKKGKQLLH